MEITAALLTAAGKFLFMDYLGWQLPFIVTASLSWITYIIYRKRKLPGILKYWGFRTDNFKTVMKKVLPFGIFSLITFIGVGLYQNTINITWHIIPILILYPVWGVIQQFLLITLTAGNMQDLNRHPLNNEIIIVTAALLFAGVHYPVLWLVAGTFVLAVFYGWVYLSERNIYVLGLFHGWLGGLFYYTVLDRDPFVEIFGKLFHFTL